MRTRNSLAVAALALIPATLSAQLGLGAVSATQFGLIIGSNIASVSEADRGVRAVVGAAYDKKRRVGLNAGIYATIPLAGPFSLQPEAHYSQQGVTFTANTTGTAPTAALKVDYVQVPVLLRIDAGSKESMIHPIFFAGASGAFRISCNVGVNSSGTNTTQQCSENTTSSAKDRLKKYDVSAVGGAGFAVHGLGRAYTLSLRYAQGLANISTESGGAAPKNSVLSIQLGIGR